MAVGRLRELRTEAISGVALTIAGIGFTIAGPPRVAGYALLGLGLLLGTYAGARWMRSKPQPPPSPLTPAPPPRRGLTLQTENSTATQWEDGTRDVTIIAGGGHASGVGKRANIGVPIVERIVDLANRVLACAANGHLQAPYKYPSA